MKNLDMANIEYKEFTKCCRRLFLDFQEVNKCLVAKHFLVLF